ncbi:MAG TPA: helix-turn-helix domain-containing protein [Candidatus Hodarchaeales archaeon]|nr:helix-turn-helix domain-containing protein [Candidatus Hodarchaeales archaeon]
MSYFSLEPTRNTIPETISDLDNSVLSVLKSKGPTTRAQLVQLTGIPRSTLYDALFRLTLKGLVKKYSDPRQANRGRPKVFFEAK